jgi:aminodeoxyfutalosine synthase
MPFADAELAALTGTRDIIALGVQADVIRRRLHGTRTTFLRVGPIAADPGAPVACPPAARELRIDGPAGTRKAAAARVREAAAAANGVPVSGFSLADLEQLAGTEKVTLRELLEDLRSCGLELVAEAPVDLLRNARRSVEEVNIAGLTLARLTLDRRPADEQIPALLTQIEQLQTDVGVIRAFAPLPRRSNPAQPSTGYDDVRLVALARIIVQNIASIQVDWALYGPKLAQMALTVGADDVDAVHAEDDTTEGRRRAPLQEILRNIRAAGLEPVERNGRFEPVSR